MAADSIQTIKAVVHGMDCPSCAGKISTALEKLTGVEEATVNLNNNTLTVSYQSLEIDEIAIRDRLTAMGYSLSFHHSGSYSQSHHQQHEPHDPDHSHGHAHHSHNHSHDNHSHHDHNHQGDHGHNHGHGEFSLKRELPTLLTVVVLFAIGLLFEQPLHDSPYSIAEYLVFIPAYLLSGWSVLKTAGRNILRGQFFDENFLMAIATLGAIAIHKLPEAVAVMMFYQIGELFQDSAVKRSRRSIQSLLEVRPDSANLKTDTGIQIVNPEQVHIGDIVLVRPGEKVPLDGQVVAGRSQLDTSTLTGESMPRSVEVGQPVLAGMINQSGPLTVQVTKRFSESSIARILELVENAGSKKAVTEKFITRFAQRYTPIVVFLSLAVALLPPLFLPGATHSEWVYRALTLLVISCPCGLVISIPLSYFGGIGGAAKRGILVKGSTYLDALASVQAVVFDKTGTLTEGVFKVAHISPARGFSSAELLQWAATAEYHSNHPIAQSIRAAYSGPIIDEAAITNYQEIPGYGIQTTVDSARLLAGTDRLLQRYNIPQESASVEGTVVHVALDDQYVGYLLIADELRAEAPAAVRSLKQLGMNPVMMLTGDSTVVAERVARSLGLDRFEAELLPEDKVTALETVMRQGIKIAFIGDGINDAPVIARADVGLAMGGLGSDAAIETADVVIMTDDPSKVAEAIQIGRKTRRIVIQNIVLAMVIKGLFILLGIVGIATLWEAVFADVGVALLAILNATRVLKDSTGAQAV